MADAMVVDPPGDVSASAIASSSNRPNLDGILLLEAPFAKVPFDELRRQQKTQQRLVERELLFCSTAWNDLAKLSASMSADGARQELVKSLEAALGRLRGLKRKLTPLGEQAKASLRMAQSRTDHLQALQNIDDSDSPHFSDWSKTRLDRMLVDYMLRRGYRGAAADLASRREIQDLVDTQLFEEIAKVEDSLYPPTWKPRSGSTLKPSCALALAWCSENKAMLRKIKTPLEFNLRLQEFIELTRVRSSESIREAISYARRHLLPLVTSATAAVPTASKGGATPAAGEKDKEADYERLAAEAVRREVSRAMGLLACGPSLWAYHDLYSEDRWAMLRDSFRACALQIHSLPAQPILHIALSAGLSSLKLPACYTQKPGHLGGKTEGDQINERMEKSEGQQSHVSVSSVFPPALGTLDTGDDAANSAKLEFSNSGPSGPSSLPVHHPHDNGDDDDVDPRGEPGNIDCPICDDQGLGKLASEVPWSHHQNSTLVCSYSGKIMDDYNPPMALPNGRVYAQNTLLELASQSPDKQSIQCPRTGDIFAAKEVRKIFIS